MTVNLSFRIKYRGGMNNFTSNWNSVDSTRTSFLLSPPAVLPFLLARSFSSTVNLVVLRSFEDNCSTLGLLSSEFPDRNKGLEDVSLYTSPEMLLLLLTFKTLALVVEVVGETLPRDLSPSIDPPRIIGGRILFRGDAMGQEL